MEYFNKYDCDQFRFYQLPKELYELERYEKISNDACVLYAMLRDRLQVSIKNNWIDEFGRVYFIYTREEAAVMIRKSKKTTIKCFDELVKVELLKEEIEGRVYKLYLGKIKNDGNYIKSIKEFKEKRKELRSKTSEEIGVNSTPIKEEIGVNFTPISGEKVEILHPSNTEYISNTKYIKKERKKKSNFDIILDSYTENNELKETILEFIKFRKGIKSNLTDRALTLLLRNLDKLTKNNNEKIEILNQSIVNGWKGVFPLKKDFKQNNSFHGKSRMERSCDYL